MKNTVLACCLSGFLVACGGGDTYIKVQGTTTISKGRELADIQRAMQEGAIDQAQYDRLKKIILGR